MNAQFKKGVLELIVLAAVEQKDMYGYEMIDQLRQKSDNVFELKVGTLYPLLHSLEKSGCLTSYEGEAAGKKRIYYRITPEGRKQLKKKTEEWSEYASAVMHVMELTLE